MIAIAKTTPGITAAGARMFPFQTLHSRSVTIASRMTSGRIPVTYRSIFSFFGRTVNTAPPATDATANSELLSKNIGANERAEKSESSSVAFTTSYKPPTLDEIINHTCHQGRTALHAAIESRSPSLVDLVRYVGADPYKADHNGITPVDLALWRLRGQEQRQIFDVLIPHPLFDRMRRKENAYEILPTQRKNLNLPEPVLHALLGDPKRPPGILARAVAEGKVGVNEVDEFGNSALHRATSALEDAEDDEGSYFHAIKELLAIGADPNLKNHAGKIPLELVDSQQKAFEAFAEWMPHAGRSSDVFTAA
ncbi:hypothetical protein HDU96_005172, partial [Phlyctochytrium bullatum]